MEIDNYKNKRNKSGIALILSLFLIILLVVILNEFIYSTKIDLYVAENSFDEIKIKYALYSALNTAIAQIKLDYLLEKDSKHKYDSFEDEWANPRWSIEKPYKSNGVIVYYTIIDENSKFNILNLIKKEKKNRNNNRNNSQNHIFFNPNNNNPNNNMGMSNIKDKKKKKGLSPSQRFERLLKLIQGEKIKINVSKFRKNIILWLTKKQGRIEEEREFIKYPIFSIKELLLVKDCRRDIFSLKIKDKIISLENYLTVWSDGKININTAPKEVLECLSNLIDDKISAKIIKYREKEDQCFKEVKDFKNIEIDPNIKNKIYNEIEKSICVNTSYFKIIAVAICNRMYRELIAIVRRENEKIYKIYCEYKE